MSRFGSEPPAAGGVEALGGLPDDPKFSAKFPATWDYLTVTRYDSGKPRQTSTVMIFVEGGGWKACVNDRARNRSAFVSATTLEALLAKVEKGLETDSLDWRSKEPGKKKW